MKNFETKRKDIQEFCKKNSFDLLILFGSSATKKTHRYSDVDIAIVPNHSVGTKPNKLDLLDQLCAMFNTDLIDLVMITSETDPLLLLEIFSKGHALFEAESGLFNKNYLRAWKHFLDTSAIRKVQKNLLMKSIRDLNPHVA